MNIFKRKTTITKPVATHLLGHFSQPVFLTGRTAGKGEYVEVGYEQVRWWIKPRFLKEIDK